MESQAKKGISLHLKWYSIPQLVHIGNRLPFGTEPKLVLTHTTKANVCQQQLLISITSENNSRTTAEQQNDSSREEK